MLSKIRHRKALLWSAGLLAAILVAIIAIALPGQPRYQGRTVNSWSADLASMDEAVRSRAVEALRQIGPEAAPYLGKVVKQEENVIRTAARRAADLLPNTVRGRIRNYFHESSARTKSLRAARALEMIGPSAASAVPELEQALHHDDPIVITAAALALLKIGPPGISILTNALFDRAPNVRGASLLALNQIGEHGEKAVPALIEMLRTPKNPESLSAVLALGRMHDLAVPGLIQLIQTSDVSVARLGVQALAATGAWGTEAVPALIQLIHAEDPGLRKDVARALGQIQAFQKTSSDALLELLKDSDADVRLAALDGLKNSPSATRRSVPILEQLLSDEKEEIQADAAFNLGQILKPDASAIPKLRELSLSGGPKARVAAARALETIYASAEISARQK